MLNDLLSLNEIVLLPPLEFAIDELLPRGGLLLFAGTPKKGKSVSVLDLVIRGIRGREAFGRYKQHYSKVLIVNIEGRHQGIKMRDPMFATLPPEILHQIVVSGKPMSFTLASGAPAPGIFSQLAQRIAEEHVDLVVLDPMVSFHAGDENNSQQMVAILDSLRSVGEATGASFIIIHHTRKSGSMQTLEDIIDNGGDMIRGAGGIFGAVDCAVMLYPLAGNRRLVTFLPRYARGDTSPVEFMMDVETMRMYNIVNDVPNPKEWITDHGVEDWDRYQKVFGLSIEATNTAKGIFNDHQVN